jgi:hypothetical protein
MERENNTAKVLGGLSGREYFLELRIIGLRRLANQSAVVPVEEFMRDLPLAIPLEQGEYIRSPGIGSSQLAGPVLNFQVNDSDAFDDLDACEARIDVRRRTIRGDPLKYVLN